MSNPFKESLVPTSTPIGLDDEQKWQAQKIYEKATSFEAREYTCYLFAAICQKLKQKYPYIHTTNSFRGKGKDSFDNNINNTVGQDVQELTKDILAGTFSAYYIDANALNRLETLAPNLRSNAENIILKNLHAHNDLLNEAPTEEQLLVNMLKFDLMREILSDILNDLSKSFHISSWKLVKNIHRSNGFSATYFVISTPYGQIEIQTQSDKNHFDAHKGSAAHSNIPGKAPDISQFFELVDPNDEKSLEYYLNLLHKTQKDKNGNIIHDARYNSFCPMPLTDNDGRLLNAMLHIKLKDNIDEELLKFAIAKTPVFMSSCSRTDNATLTTFDHHNFISSFEEILKMEGETTCLGNSILKKLEPIYQKTLENNPELLNTFTENGKLPQELSDGSIIEYLEKLSKAISSQHISDVLTH